MSDKISKEKLLAGVLIVLLIISLFPVMYLGRYNHPTGDDYYYGVETYHEWRESGNIFNVLRKAAEGAALEYRQWQGTYSAMFLMYLPPNIWGDSSYHMVTAVIIALLAFAIFYFWKPVIMDYGKGSFFMWFTLSAVSVLLCVETVPSQGETFFWYNGAMYYTGFFSLSLIFLGMFLRLLRGNKLLLILILPLAVFLSGGNYVSLLPLMIIMTLLSLYFIIKRPKNPSIYSNIIYSCIILLFLLAAFAVNALAPGNSVRQSGMWQIPAWKAILKSLFQGVKYLLAWIDLWWLSAVLCLTPVFIKHYKTSESDFRYPAAVTILTYGIFCSMSCPLFYTMNSTGPARAVAIVYYAFILCTLFLYYYWLGALYRFIRRKNILDKYLRSFPINSNLCLTSIFIIIILIIAIQTANGALMECTTSKAVRLIADGEAAAYDEEYRNRMSILHNPSISDVELTPYIHRPDMLYVGDFSGDTLDPTNLRVAAYFDKESVFVRY